MLLSCKKEEEQKRFLKKLVKCEEICSGSDFAKHCHHL